MSILIKGLFGKDMPIPQEGYVDIRIHFKSGKLKCVTMQTGEDPFYATFDVEKLPPHGRLGDLDELYKVANMADDFGADTLDMLKLIADTPTVIEAEGSEE